MAGDGPATLVTADFSESAELLATSWPYVLVGESDSGELVRLNLGTADRELLVQPASQITLTAADDSRFAMLTASGALFWVDVRTGTVSRGQLPDDSAAAREFVRMELTAGTLQLQSRDMLLVFRTPAH